MVNQLSVITTRTQENLEHDPGLQKPFGLQFKPHILERLSATAEQIAILVTPEYEGIFKNGGIGTYYATLSQKLTQSGWYVILLLCQTEQYFYGNSSLTSVNHIFSVNEVNQVLHLQPTHQAILSGLPDWDWLERESFSSLFFTQAVISAFGDIPIYVEFPDMCGLGYRTIQAKRAGFLDRHCITAVTLHSTHEWIYEVNEKYPIGEERWLRQVNAYEQYSFEHADLAFFLSHFLKEKIEHYGWKTRHAIHLPYCFPIIEEVLFRRVLNESQPVQSFLDHHLDSGKIPLVFFGRLEERKGLCTFLTAIQSLAPEITKTIDAIFLGKTVQLYSVALNHLSSEDYIRQELDGIVSYTIISDLFSHEAIQFIRDLQKPIVCLTSPQENFPNSSLEVGQLPVSLVVAKTGGFQETLGLIERTHNVSWFEPGDVRSLAQTITRSLSTHFECPTIPDVTSLQEINRQLLTKRLMHMNQAYCCSMLSQEDFELESDDLSMLSFEERSFLKTYIRDHYSGQGEIVDLGCWLGSSTVSLAVGLCQNPCITSRKNRIHAYDIFKWASWMDASVTNTHLEGVYQNGDNFVGSFKDRTHLFKPLIQIHEGDLIELGWIHKKIEFLFIDAMKSWPLTNGILKAFFSSLIPGLSLVQHQDFAHYSTPWIHLIMYQLRDYFEPLDHPFMYTSKVFRYIKEIPNSLLTQSYSFDFFSEQDIEDAFDYSSSIVSTKMHANLAAAKVNLWIQIGHLEKARAELDVALSRFVAIESSDPIDQSDQVEQANVLLDELFDIEAHLKQLNV